MNENPNENLRAFAAQLANNLHLQHASRQRRGLPTQMPLLQEFLQELGRLTSEPCTDRIARALNQLRKDFLQQTDYRLPGLKDQINQQRMIWKISN